MKKNKIPSSPIKPEVNKASTCVSFTWSMNLQDMQQQNTFTFFCFLYVFPTRAMEKKKWNLQSSALYNLSAERCLLPRHYVPCYCAALFSLFYFIIFVLVLNVKLRKETNYDINRSLRWARRFIYAWRLHDA